MKQIVCICGDLAAGKSEFSKVLSKSTGLLCLNKDTIKEILGDSVGFSNREENLRLSGITFSIMYYCARKSVEAGASIILESNFRQREIDAVWRLANEAGYALKCIVLEADIDVLYRRFQNRIENENRHPVHCSVRYDTEEAFKITIDEWRKIKYPGTVLRVDNTDFEVMRPQKLKELANFVLKG